MKRLCYNDFFVLAFIAGLFFVSGCDNRITQEAGFLTGAISIGPICPVEKDPPDPACLPTAETYKAYPVSIWTSDGKRKIAQINPESDGTFIITLPPGDYRIILEKEQNSISSSNLPAEVSIISLKKTLLNIEIDTGIR